MDQHIGRYQILEEVASGGQGVVYRAFDPDTGQIVALKVLHASLANDKNYVERFRREASLASSIDHPNVVKVFEVGKDGDQHFMALEFLPESLGRVIEAGGRMRLDRVAEFGVQIADGLAEAHVLGIVHRDVKPQNILIGADGIAKVADFGIARSELLTTMTATGTVTGTPSYMSPEQARGEEADPRSDVYSLGCMLYQMVTGELPFIGDTPLAVIRQQIEDHPTPARELRADLTPRLETLVERAMAKDAESRFQSVSDLSAALRDALFEVESEPRAEAGPQVERTVDPPTQPAERPSLTRMENWSIVRTSDAALSRLGLLVEVRIASNWRVFAVVSVAVLALVGLALTYSAVKFASAAGTDLSELRATLEGSLAEAQGTELEEASAEIGLVRQRLETPIRLVRWVGRLGAAVPWLPLLSLEASAVEAQVDRIDTDLEAASGLLDWAGRFISTYDEAQMALVSSLDTQPMDSFRSPLREIEAGFGRSGGAAGRGGPGARYSLLAHLGPISDRLDDLAEAEGTIRDGADAGEKAARLVQVLLDLAEVSRPLVSRFEGNGVGLDADSAVSIFAALASFQGRAVAARATAAETSAALARLEQAGPFAARLESLGRLMDALVAIGDAGVLGFDALRPAHDIVAASQNGLLDGERALSRALATLPERSSDISRAVAQLAEGEKALRELQADGSLPLGSSGLPGILNFVTQVREGLQMLNGVAPVASLLLGESGPRRYLLLGQSADELRGAGGFVSGIWTLDVQDGSLGEVAYYDVVRVDDWKRLMLYPVAPPGLEEHMNAWVWLLRDVSWDPDFRVTAQSAKAMFKIGQRQDVDGVVAVNQWGLLGLIGAVGGVTPPEGGDPITADNLITVLEQGTDTYGRAYVDLVLQGVIDKMANGTSLPALVRLASAMFRALQSRDLVLHFDDPDAQAVMEELGWAGVIEPVRGDYLYVVDSNVGWSKVDRNIEREVSYLVDLSKKDRPRARLTLGYVNHSGPGSPPCEPQWLNRGTDYSQLVNSCYWNFVRVYIPLDSRLLSQTNLPLPELSVSVEIGKGSPGQETGKLSASHDKAMFSGLAVVPPGETREIALIYDLPEGSLANEDGSLVYRLTVQKQSGVKTRRTTVSLVPPLGYRVSASSVPYEVREDGQVTISLSLMRDEAITVAFVED